MFQDKRCQTSPLILQKLILTSPTYALTSMKFLAMSGASFGRIIGQDARVSSPTGYMVTSSGFSSINLWYTI